MDTVTGCLKFKLLIRLSTFWFMIDLVGVDFGPCDGLKILFSDPSPSFDFLTI